MIALLLAAAALAAPDALSLSYEAALQAALEANPDLLGATAELRRADGALLAARSAFDPQLSADAGTSSSNSESFTSLGDTLVQADSTSANASLSQFFATGTTASLSWQSTRSRYRYELRDSGFVFETEDPQVYDKLAINLQQPLLEGVRMATNLEGVRQARQSRDLAELRILETRQRVLGEVAQAYWELWYRRRLVEIAEKALAVAEEEKRVVAAKVAEGRLAPVENARAEAARVQAESGLIEARTAADEAADALLVLLGEAPGRPLELTTRPAEATAMDIDEDAAVETALGHNPSVLIARLGEEMAEADLADARHARLPELAAVGSFALTGYETSGSAALKELASGDLSEFYVGGQLAVPLGNRADRGDYLAKQAAAEKARIDREALERDVTQQVRAQVRAIETAKARVDLAEANLKLAEETLAADRALAEAGRAIQRDVLESIKNVDDARVALEKARADYVFAVVTLKWLQGGL